MAARALLAATFLAGLGALPAAAQPAAERFDSFMRTAAAPCSVAPARICIDAAWGFADRDGDGQVSAAELEAVKNELGVWAEWKKPSMGQSDRASLAIGQMMVRSVKPEQLVQGFDSDGDGSLSQAELTQDLTLDDRPLPEILQDRDSVDWPAVQKRLGSIAPLIALLAQAQGAQ